MEYKMGLKRGGEGLEMGWVLKRFSYLFGEDSALQESIYGSFFPRTVSRRRPLRKCSSTDLPVRWLHQHQ